MVEPIGRRQRCVTRPRAASAGPHAGQLAEAHPAASGNSSTSSWSPQQTFLCSHDFLTALLVESAAASAASVRRPGKLRHKS